MSTQAILRLTADAAPQRCLFAVVALLIVARAVYGRQAPLRRHPLCAEALERYRLTLTHPIGVPLSNDWLAPSLHPRPFRLCLLAAICCDRPIFAVPALPVARFVSRVRIEAAEIAPFSFTIRISIGQRLRRASARRSNKLPCAY